MKKSMLVFALCLLQVYQVMAQRINDVDAIKAAIERETNAYFNIDYKTWLDSWLHAPYAYWSFVDSSGISQYEGWDAIEIGFTDYFITSKPVVTEIERNWQEIRVYGNGAFARFKQRVITNGMPGAEQTEIRILEKDKKNVWKIVLVGVLKHNAEMATVNQY
ncbi:MAG TPA: hypothetical protein VD816_10920 [Ohtaekwangia sp.]|nr:hypothetical protein [Ohtaekwangia sp.]